MANTYLSKTITPSNYNRRKFTFSAWIKKANDGTNNYPILGFHGSNDYTALRVSNSSKIDFICYQSSSTVARKISGRQLRDQNGWYHLVFAFDTDNSTAANRNRIYVNGEEITNFDTDTNASSGLDLISNNQTNFDIGSNVDQGGTRSYFGGSMSHVHYCEGYQYAASDFGSTDSTTGEWKINPSPSVSYGTNGFFIFKDGNSGSDQSPNSNNWSVTSGTLTKTEDCPSNVFATLNPLLQQNDITLSNGNNTCAYGSSGTRNVMLSTLGMSSGKYYCELKVSASSASPANGNLGVINGSDNSSMGTYLNQTNSVFQGAGYQMWDGSKNINQTGSSYGATLAAGDILGMAIDMDNKALYFHKNGTYQDSGDPTSGSSKTGAVDFSSLTDNGFWFVLIGDASGAQTMTMQMNFGNGYFGTTAVSSAGTNASGIGIFEYDVPTGYTALSTKGLNE